MKKALICLVALASFLTSCSSGYEFKEEVDNTRIMNIPELKAMMGLIKTYDQTIRYLDSIPSEENVMTETKLQLGRGRNANSMVVDTLKLWDETRVNSFMSGGMSSGGIGAINFKQLFEMKRGDIRYSNFMPVIEELKKRRYLVYARHLIATLPKMQGNSNFESGVIITRLSVYDLVDKKVIFRTNVATTNSDEIQTSNYGIKEMDLSTDLLKNYNRDIDKALSEGFNLID